MSFFQIIPNYFRANKHIYLYNSKKTGIEASLDKIAEATLMNARIKGLFIGLYSCTIVSYFSPRLETFMIMVIMY